MDNFSIGSSEALFSRFEMGFQSMGRPFRSSLNETCNIVASHGRVAFRIEDHIDVTNQSLLHALIVGDRRRVHSVARLSQLIQCA